MMLTVVGCSGSAPGPGSACSCHLVESGGFRLLLDLGTGAVGPLQRYASVTDIDAVFISHGHADHCHDLRSLRYLRARADSGMCPVYGSADVAATAAPVAVEPVPASIGPWAVRTAPGRHHRPNQAIRLDDRLCYTGDTAPCPGVEEIADGCAVLLAEAAGFDADRPENHLTAGDAGRLAARSHTRLLVLTHLRPWHDPGRILAEASRHAPCPVVLAVPGLRLGLR
jgi:ribonuclease BN (tRNA processing enzyme)